MAGAHGVRGEVRVRVFGDDPGHLLAAGELWLASAGGARTQEDGASEPPERFEVVRAAAGRSGEVRIALAGVEDRQAAAALRGRRVLVPAEALDELPEGEFYWHQLVGCRAEDERGATLGTVVELWETGAHDVLVVDAGDGRRHLIPAARELVPEIDVEARVVRVRVIPGLLEPVPEEREQD